MLDLSQGDLESTGNPLDVAILGDGFFAVRHRGQTMLTRDGRFHVNQQGNLALAAGGQEVLDDKAQPIPISAALPVSISGDGAITQAGKPAARLGLYDLADRSLLRKRGQSMLVCPDLEKRLRPGSAQIRSTFVERANAEPTTELAALLDAQRQLEANANMIRYQDQTLSRLVNDVGKIG
jgi:flagellar basal body rod protein FlgG